MSPSPVVRERVDACPGALTLHEAADGPLARVRLPGGSVSASQWAALLDAAALGDGGLELTSRGNVQLRAVRDRAAVADVLAAGGLLPSPTHERVRNILASPLAGLDGGEAVDDLVHALDLALCARPELADLPGRFLFAVDDGRGDVAGMDADVTLVASGGVVRVCGAEVARADAVGLALDVAAAFLAERAAQGGGAWRITELDGGRAAVAARVPALDPSTWVPGTAALGHPVGPVRQPDGRHALVLLAPLGRLDAAQAAWLGARIGERGLRVTPWRSVVLPDVDDVTATADAAIRAGLGVDAASPWYRVSACTGRPGCARALADVQADARAQAGRWPGRTVRWSGCARRCGRPPETDIDMVATENGYLVSEA